EPSNARDCCHERKQEGGARVARGHAIGMLDRPHTNALSGARGPPDRARIVSSVQGNDALDPRCYAPIGLEPRTRALLTAVPLAGALLREGLSSRRQRPFWAVTLCAAVVSSGRHRPFWAVTLRAVDGPAAGAHAELRLWPESNPEWFQGRLSLLCDADPETIAALTLDEQHALLLRNLAQRSYAGILETAADGLADVAYLDG